MRLCPRPALPVVAAVAGLLVLTGCATGLPSTVPGQSKVLSVVAAENVWGSIAAQLGGRQVRVRSIIASPAADPHSYEATASDARAFAAADLVVVNGIGYDTWASQLVAADASPGPLTLTVGTLLGLGDGQNPHRWYNPTDVDRVVGALVADYQRLDPADSAYFASRAENFRTVALAPYHAVIGQIRARYAGTPVGASESIFAMLSPALGLNLLTPSGFLRAVSEGTDPTAADKATIDAQISGRQIAVYVYNSQNQTPDVRAQIDQAAAAHIPVTAVTETLSPASATWQQWQTSQLVALRDALAAAATGGR